MVDARAFIARQSFWPTFFKYLLIVLGVAAFGTIGYIGFNLALGSTGCPMFWNVFALICGSHTGMVLALCLFVTPIAAYFAIKRPWLFPVSLYALLVPSDSYLNFSSLTGGSSLTKIAGILAVSSMMWYLIRNKRFVNPGSAVTAWLAYGAFSTLTLLWGFHVEDGTITLWLTLWQLILLYVVLAVAEIDDQEFRIIMACWIVGCMIASVFGASVFGLNGAKFDNVGRLKAYFSPDNKLLSDLFSASFVFPIALVTMQALRERWSLKKVGLILVFGVLLIGQFVVGSRGGILADFCATLYFIAKGRYRSQLVFLGCLAMTLTFAYPTATWGRILKPDPSGGSGRVEIWKVGWESLKQYWLFGAGYAQFQNVYDKNFLTVFNAIYESWHRGPHNIILQTWVEQGIFGLGIMLFAWWLTFKSMDHIPKGDVQYDFRIAVEAGVMGAFIAAIFVGVMLSKFTFWMLVIVALCRQVSMRKLKADQAARASHLDRVVVLDTGPPGGLDALPASSPAGRAR